MSDVFISYSRKDKPFVQRLHAALAAEGRDTWVDWEDIEYTEDWWAGIEAGIENADTFVFVISPDSAASEVCHQEINHAAAHNKRLVPIVYREAPTDQVPEKLQPLNWLFFRQSDDFDRVFQDLIRVMDTDLEWVKAHTRLTVRAVEWESHDRNDSFVLRGDDLKEAEQRLDQRDKEPQLTELQVQYIVASQRSAIRRRGRVLGAVAVGLIVTAVLGVIAFLMFQASQREAALRQTEAKARQTAESIMTTAEAEADVAATRAGEAQAAAYVAETAEAEALGAQATAVAARQTADAGRQAAVVAEQTAQAARAVALTQQAQAEQNEAAAVAAQQTAQAAEQAAVQARQTAQAGQATAQASQATAVAQQAEAEAAAQQARQAQAEAEAAAREAEQAKQEAEAAAQQAQQAQAEAEAAQAAAQATLVAVEALRDEAERDLREARQTAFILKYSEVCGDCDHWSNDRALAYDGTNIWVVSSVSSWGDSFARVSASDCIRQGFDAPPWSEWGSFVGDITYGGDRIYFAMERRIYAVDLSGDSVWETTVGSGSIEDVLYAEDSLWLATSSDGIYKLDPDDGQELAHFKEIDAWLLAYDGTYIWAAKVVEGEEMDRFSISRIYASSDEPLDDPSIKLKGQARRMLHSDGYIWVLAEKRSPLPDNFVGWTGTYLYKITDSIVEIELDKLYDNKTLSDFAFDGVNIWSVDTQKNELLKIDGNNGTVLSASLAVGEAGITFDGANLWVCDGSLYKIPISGHPVGESPSAMAEDGDCIWVANSGSNTVSKIRASTGALVGTFEVGQSPLELIVADENIWVLNAGDNTVSKLRRADGQELGTFSLGSQSSYYDLAYDGAYIWATQDGAVTRLREDNGEYIDTTQVPNCSGQTRILYDGSSMWLLCASSNSLQKLNIDASVALAYSLLPGWGSADDFSSHDFSYDGINFWVVQQWHSSAEMYDAFITQLVPESSLVVGPDYIASWYYCPGTLGIAYDDHHYVWVGYSESSRLGVPLIRLEAPTLANPIPFSASVCEPVRGLLYHREPQSFWVSCSNDNAIQKIYSYQGLPESSTLGPASLPPVTLGDGGRSVYLPLIMKEAAPAAAAAEPRRTPGITGPPLPATPTATATMTPIPIPIATPTATAAGP